MGVWTTGPNGKSVWRDEFPDTPEGQAAAQADTTKRAASQSTNNGTQGTGATAPQAASSSAGGSTTNTPFANAFAQNNGGTQPTTGDPNAYEFGPRNDDPIGWSQRAFRQGLADYGPSNMNPFIASNPDALLPYQQWVQSRYGTSAGLNQMVASMIGGGDMAESSWQPRFQQMIQSNNFGPTTTAGSMQNMQAMQGLVDKVMKPGGTTGDVGRDTELQKINATPQDANSMALAQFSNLGGYLGSFLGNKLNNLAQQYQGSSSLSSGSQGSYWDLMMKMLQGGGQQ